MRLQVSPPFICVLSRLLRYIVISVIEDSKRFLKDIHDLIIYAKIYWECRDFNVWVYVRRLWVVLPHIILQLWDDPPQLDKDILDLHLRREIGYLESQHFVLFRKQHTIRLTCSICSKCFWLKHIGCFFSTELILVDRLLNFLIGKGNCSYARFAKDRLLRCLIRHLYLI